VSFNKVFPSPHKLKKS